MRGFTLIEVLIVVAIVGIIAAIGYGGVRQQRLVHECMDDGKKEYECAALIERRYYRW